MSSEEPPLCEGDYLDWLELLKAQPDDLPVAVAEAEHRAWLERRLPEVADEITECLPQEVRDAGIRFGFEPPEWPDSEIFRPPVKPITFWLYDLAPPGLVPSSCYQLSSGMVHIKPGCRCPR